MADLKLFATLSGPFIDLTNGKKIAKEAITDVSKVSILKLMDGTGAQHGIDELLQFYQLKAEVPKRGYAEYTLEPSLTGNVTYPAGYVLPYTHEVQKDPTGNITMSGGLFTIKKGIYKLDVNVTADSVSGGAATFGYQIDGVLTSLINTAQAGVHNYSHIVNVSARDSSQFFICCSAGSITIPTTKPMGRCVIVQLA